MEDGDSAAEHGRMPAVEVEVSLLSPEVVIEDTGRRVPHPESCGGCHGKGCRIVRLVEIPEPPLVRP